MKICKLPQLVSDLTRLHTFISSFFQGQAGPLNTYFRGPAQKLGALGYWAPVSLFPCIPTNPQAVSDSDVKYITNLLLH